jgi:hypothetical protein
MPRKVRVDVAETPQRLRSPITSEVQYTDDERDFLLALDRYKRLNRRPCPTWREVLAVAVSVGFRRVGGPGPLPVFGGRPSLKVKNA